MSCNFASAFFDNFKNRVVVAIIAEMVALVETSFIRIDHYTLYKILLLVLTLSRTVRKSRQIIQPPVCT